LRPDVVRAAAQERLATEGLTMATAGYLPTAALQGSVEANGPTFGDRASSWTVGAVFRWNLFAGFSDQARRAEAKSAIERARSDRRRVEALVRMDLRQALSRVREARAREDVGRSIQDQARESHRIVRDRYESGLASINDLLRAANAVLDADVQHTASTVDVVISAAMLERARGK
jgi:outer membrane protein TolC